MTPAFQLDMRDEWRRTFDAIADGVAILDAHGRILRCNRAMADLAGTPCDDLIGQPASVLVPWEGSTDDVIAGARAGRQRVTSERAVRDRLYRIAADPMVDEAGLVERIVLIVGDITAHRQLEEDHRRRAEQLAELDRRKDEFLGMLAHELRNPLNAIAAANSLMERIGAQDPKNVRLRTTIQRQTRHLARLVVVEDNRDAREMLHAWLEELGHRVHTAADGFEGLSLARSVKPDVALVDIGLPGLDGYQVAQNLRASGDCRETMLVAITGYGRPEDSARAREAGFDAHLVKPVQPDTLARLIHAPKQGSSSGPAFHPN
ncbi:MAG: response regulator [Acidobacteria bacterium]|nr:response regulator [Acidobacteriota bacterium]